MWHSSYPHDYIRQLLTVTEIALEEYQPPFAFSEQTESPFFNLLTRDVRNLVYKYVDPLNSNPFHIKSGCVAFMLTCRLAHTEITEAIEHDWKKSLPVWKSNIREEYQIPQDELFEVDFIYSLHRKHLRVILSYPYSHVEDLLLELAHLPFRIFELHMVGKKPQRKLDRFLRKEGWDHGQWMLFHVRGPLEIVDILKSDAINMRLRWRGIREGRTQAGRTQQQEKKRLKEWTFILVDEMEGSDKKRVERGWQSCACGTFNFYHNRGWGITSRHRAPDDKVLNLGHFCS
jgi:hypothetical protein